jgi:hypothetical protein
MKQWSTKMLFQWNSSRRRAKMRETVLKHPGMRYFTLIDDDRMQCDACSCLHAACLIQNRVNCEGLCYCLAKPFS